MESVIFWPPLQRAAAPQNPTSLHLETLCIESGIRAPSTSLSSRQSEDTPHIAPHKELALKSLHHP